MRVAIVALDTRGGVQPYAALAFGLRAAGHQVNVAASSDSAGSLTASGLDVIPVDVGDRSAVEASQGVAEMSARERNRFMRTRLLATIAAGAEQVTAACRDAEVVLGGVGGSVIGAPVAEKLGIPFLTAHLQPIGPPSPVFPGPLLPRLPRPLWRVSHRWSAMAMNLPFAAAVKHLRTQVLGLPARARPVGEPGLPAIYGYSPRVVPHPPQWGPERKVTGYWNLPTDPAWAPPANVTAFLDSGPPPVAVGFGSMSSTDPDALTTLVVDAARAAGVRLVLLSGLGALREAHGDDVLVLPDLPHEWLYPRMAAVVHHGGAGTTGAAVRSGAPQVVVPFAVDQPFWAARVASLGVGPTPVPRKHLTAERLTVAITAAVTDPRVRTRAAALREAVRTEQGVHEAVHHLQAYWERPRQWAS